MKIKCINSVMMGKVLAALVVNLFFVQLATAASWVTNNPMANRRLYTTATTLQDGRVLVVGGYDGGQYSATSEVYNPTNGTWTSTAPMLLGRYKHTATLLSNGKVLVAGGFFATNNSDPNIYWIFRNEAELFDPVTLTWTNTGSMHVGRDRHVATLLTDGKVLVTGGLTDPAGSTTTSAELYDPATGQWTVTGSLAASRFFHSVTVLRNGKALATGGSQYPIPYNSGVIAYLSSSELYDPVAETWSPTGPLAVSRGVSPGVLLPSGKVMVAGGESTNTSLASVELYDPGSGTWTNTGTLNSVRERHQCALLPNGKVIVAGGDNMATYFNTAEIYDPGTETWTPVASLNVPRNNFVSSVLRNGNLLVAGGQNPSGYLSQSEIYSSSNITVTASRLTQPASLSGGTFQFSFTNTPDVSFLAYATTNLSNSMSNWTILGSAVEVAPGQYQFNDPQTGTNSRRFYRVRSP